MCFISILFKETGGKSTKSLEQKSAKLHAVSFPSVLATKIHAHHPNRTASNLSPNSDTSAVVPAWTVTGPNLIYLGKESFIEPRNLSAESSQCSSDLHPLYIPALPIKGPRVFTAASIKKKFSTKDLPKGHRVLLEGNKEWDICKVQAERMRLSLHSPSNSGCQETGAWVYSFRKSHFLRRTEETEVLPGLGREESWPSPVSSGNDHSLGPNSLQSERTLVGNITPWQRWDGDAKAVMVYGLRLQRTVFRILFRGEVARGHVQRPQLY